MELIALPFAFLLWFLAYEAKPIRKDEIGLIWEEENVLKRLKITNIFNENNWIKKGFLVNKKFF